VTLAVDLAVLSYPWKEFFESLRYWANAHDYFTRCITATSD